MEIVKLEKKIFKRYLLSVCVVLVLGMCFASPARSSSLGLSVVDRQGNTNKQSINVDAKHMIESKDKRNTQDLKGGLSYGETDRKRDAESWYANLKDSHVLTDDRATIAPYWFNMYGIESDEFAGYNLRLSSGLGLGLRLKSADHNFNLEAGPALICEEEKGYNQEEDVWDVYASARGFQSWTWRITDRISFNEESEYVVPYEDQKNYRVNGEAGIVGMINNYLSVKIGPKVRYVNHPPEGKKRADITTSATVIFNF